MGLENLIVFLLIVVIVVALVSMLLRLIPGLNMNVANIIVLVIALMMVLYFFRGPVFH